VSDPTQGPQPGEPSPGAMDPFPQETQEQLDELSLANKVVGLGYQAPTYQPTYVGRDGEERPTLGPDGRSLPRTWAPVVGTVWNMMAHELCAPYLQRCFGFAREYNSREQAAKAGARLLSEGTGRTSAGAS
jgi:hypothetical protein